MRDPKGQGKMIEIDWISDVSLIKLDRNMPIWCMHPTCQNYIPTNRCVKANKIL